MTPPGAAAVAGAAPATHRGRSTAPARPSIAPRKPRRVSGPVRPSTRTPAGPPARRPARPAAPAVQTGHGLVPGLLAALNAVAGNRSLDRLIRSRTWIALIAFALIGIVALQLLVLRLNANIGHALVRESQLQRENAALSIESSELAAGERVESEAARLGMELVPEGSLRFLTSDPGSDIARAAAALKAPVQPSSTNPSSSTSSTAATASTGESSEAPSGEQAATQEPAATPEPATSASGAAGTGEALAPVGTEAPAAETAPAEPSSTATATGAAEAAAGGVGATQSNPAG
jgi:pilus assembly protein FimV